jgi:hypothetical protein
MLTRDALRIVELESQLHRERAERLKAQQRAAGMRSTVLRLQAQPARQRAEVAEKKAEASS